MYRKGRGRNGKKVIGGRSKGETDSVRYALVCDLCAVEVITCAAPGECRV